MLVLTRKPGEETLLDVPGWPTIRLVQVSCASGKARLGIVAPKEVKILRAELAHLTTDPSPEGRGEQAA
jgi:carbon storage regulator CsrA